MHSVLNMGVFVFMWVCLYLGKTCQFHNKTILIFTSQQIIWQIILYVVIIIDVFIIWGSIIIAPNSGCGVVVGVGGGWPDSCNESCCNNMLSRDCCPGG